MTKDIKDEALIAEIRVMGEGSTAILAQCVGALRQRPAVYRRLNALVASGVLRRRRYGNAVLWSLAHSIPETDPS